MSANRVVLGGRIGQLEPVRYTPAGIPIRTFILVHESTQSEAGRQRLVSCEIPVTAAAEAVKATEGIRDGDEVEIEGFLAARSRHTPRPALHVTKLRLIERG